MRSSISFPFLWGSFPFLLGSFDVMFYHFISADRVKYKSVRTEILSCVFKY